MGKDINAPSWLKAFLHSFSIVVFVENIISGFLILAGIFVFSYEINNFDIGILAVIGAIIGNVTAKLLGNDENAIVSGLFGFNTVLVGIGAATFFKGADAYIVGILGSVLTIPLTTVINNLCARLELPGFTMPFIAMTWFLILVSFQTNLLTVGRAGALSATKTLSTDPLVWSDVLTKGLGEIYLLDSMYASLLIFAAFAIDRWHLAIKIALTILATIGLGLLFKVDYVVLNLGLYTYNSILVLMGLETFSTSKKNPVKYALIVALGILTAVLVDYATPSVLGVFALPSLTFPFVLTTWGVLYFEKHLKA